MTLADLLTECAAKGIRLLPADYDRLTIDGPSHAITPEIVAGLTAHKAEILATRCRCGSTTFRDVPIHKGRSIRRDCVRCGHFVAFLVWYGKATVSQ